MPSAARFTLLCSLALAACAAPTTDDELIIADEVAEAPSAGKADAVEVPFTVLTVALPAGVGDHETRAVFTTARAFRSYLGVEPTGVNFARSYVFFYSAGLQPTDGYRASVERVSTSRSGKTLKITTGLEAPAADCAAADVLTKPHVLVVITRPTPRPQYVAFYHRDDERPCPVACAAPVPTDLATLDLAVTGRVRAVFLAPSDRPLAGCLQERLDTWLGIARDFFADELAAEGFTDAAGAGKTFRAETDPAGRWQVVYLIGEHEASWYHAQVDAAGNPDAPGAALAEMYRRLPTAYHRDNVVIYYYDLAVVEGGRVLHSGNGGSGAPWEGEGAGYVLQGAHFLGLGFPTVATNLGDQAALFEQGEPAGVEEWSVDGEWRAVTRGEYASTFVGAAIHELGHAFYLDHIFTDYDGDGIETNLMGNGFRRFGGRFTPRGPQPATGLGPDQARLLDAAPMFNR